MYAITGATGGLGRAAIDTLLKTVPASEIVAVVRNADKAADLAARGVSIRVADYNDPAALEAAFRGVNRLLFISNADTTNREAEHGAVIAAAKRAGVGYVVYTSVLRADRMTLPLAAGHRWTEAALKASGIPTAIARHGWYMENYTPGIPAGLQFGAITSASGTGRVAAATKADYAAFDVKLLVEDGHAGQTYEVAGDTPFTEAEFAAELARQSGKLVAFNSIPEADYATMLAGFGFPAPVAAVFAGASAAVARGELFDEDRVLSRMLGRPTTTLPEVIAAELAAR